MPSSWRAPASWLVEHRLSPAARARHPAPGDRRAAASASRPCSSPSRRRCRPSARPGCRACWRRSRTAGSAGVEWLGAVPSSKGAKGLAEQIEKVGFLKELGADRLAPAGSAARRSRAFRETDDVAQTGGAGADQGSASHDRGRLLPAPHAVAADGREPHASRSSDRGPVARRAGTRVEASQASRLRRFRQLLGDLAGLADDETLDAAELRARLREPDRSFRTGTHGEPRSPPFARNSGANPRSLARLLKTGAGGAIRRFRPAISSPPPLRRSIRSPRVAQCVAGGNAAQPFGPSWQALIDQPDRAAALGCFRAATLMALEAGAAEPLGLGRSQPVVPGAARTS